MNEFTVCQNKNITSKTTTNNCSKIHKKKSGKSLLFKMSKPTLNLKQVSTKSCKLSQPINEESEMQQFLLRQEVLKLYRDIFRTIRKVPDDSSRKELKEWTRSDFRNNLHHTEEITIKMLLNHGKRSLSELRTSLELSGTKT